MADLEIPFEKDRRGHYRFFEILPGALSYFMLFLPVILSFVNVPFIPGQAPLNLGVLFMLVYLLINFTRGIAGAVRGLHGFHVMKVHQRLPWSQMLKELEAGAVASHNAKRPKWHLDALTRSKIQPLLMPPGEVIHAIIVATYKESREVLQPTIESVLSSDFNMKNVLLVLAYEGRAGEQTEELAQSLQAEYKKKDVFMDFIAVAHPAGLPGEIVGKGGNINFAARKLQQYLKDHDIDPVRVMVTTLDADNRPDKNYLNALTYVYVAAPDPIHASYQPVSLYTNNIWDAPAPMRVIATGNSLFNLVVSLRLHALRNFSSHAQPMAALIETDFWSARTVVEDGHQFWRSYFAFQGKYRVLPLHVPISQDAVLSESYRKTLKAQFIQLRRWTYGASDIAYVAEMGFFRKNKISKLDLLGKFWRLLEGHVTWAVGPILILVGGFIPSQINHKFVGVYELPLLVSRIQTVGVLALVVTLFLSLRTLPPKPARYKRHRTVFMVLQWVYFPVTTLLYNCLAAFNSQTRLIFKRYLTKFDVTEKAVVVETAAGGVETKK
ncbi:MAG TPA: glycosyltransferase family 2 protein [Candidatus Saccharimonadales bacterium]|nr:glycosyltransferase family 2 protein [Candidatus Saccharimonadales bacterium]